MFLAHYITPGSTVILHSADKNTALRSLLQRLHTEIPSISEEELLQRVLQREEKMTSHMGSGIAIPHVVIEDLDSTYIALGISHGGVQWDPDKQATVHLIILMVGGPTDHLRVLSEIASQLKDGVLYERLLQSSSEVELYNCISAPIAERKPMQLYHGQDITELTFKQGMELASHLTGARVVLHGDAFEEAEHINHIIGGQDVLVVTQKLDLYTACSQLSISTAISPLKGVRGTSHIQFVLLFLLSQEVIGPADIIVNISGPVSSGYLDSIHVSSLQDKFRFPVLFSQKEGVPQLSHHILTRILQIVGELSAEGREGHAIGTLFVFGDYENVQKYSRQMIANPFSGLAEADRNILDPNLEETLKEYAKIDGAFIIRDDGTLISAGTYLAGIPNSEELQQGLGARHTSAQGISAVTHAMAIALSESTRKISVYYGGKRLVVM